jgi:hypothetical protein
VSSKRISTQYLGWLLLPYAALGISAAQTSAAGAKPTDPAQLFQRGDGSPEYHLFAGKYHLKLEQYDRALAAGGIDNDHRANREKQAESGTVPSPELLPHPQ